MFGKRKKEALHFDVRSQDVVIVSSICTGERILCFEDKATGVRHQIACIQSDGQLHELARRYGFSERSVRFEW